ncbi:MAG: hypothetical protein GQ582_08175 [Methyloprofundus sp.]|nr:hypothetical protein [Methyloprofundus sp.]
MLAFSDRELKSAWRNNLTASELVNKTNAHRLLLFYAIECGLKVIILKGENKNRTDRLSKDLKEYGGHDINKLLTALHAPSKLHLKATKMNNLRNPDTPRNVGVGDFNQMWRYGGSSYNPVLDSDIENQLLKISQWVRQEINA